MPESISISIPAYNEEQSLRELVQQSIRVLSGVTEDYEVLVINDGSRDRTPEIADQLARENSRVRVIHHRHNLGFGLTLQETFKEPSKQWVFFIPGDGQIPPDELLKLWPARMDANFILGWRVHRQDPWQRRLTAGIYNVLISVLMGRRIHDVDSVVLFHRSVIENIDLRSRSVFLHAEFCLKALRSGARLKEVPIDHRPRKGGQARGNQPGVIWKTLQELMRYTISGN